MENLTTVSFKGDGNHQAILDHIAKQGFEVSVWKKKGKHKTKQAEVTTASK